jgi:hypothetical protein
MPVPNPVEGPRPLTRAQGAQNRRFLEALARTGNARLAARELGLNRSTFTKRRARHPAFAALWEAALQAAQVRLARARQTRQPGTVIASEAKQSSTGSGSPRRSKASDGEQGLRTTGGEPHVIRLKGGRLQLRRALPGRMTPAAEQLFLTMLSETNNIRLAAAAAGFAHSSFIATRRRSPTFAAQMDEAAAASPQAIDRHLARAATTLTEHLAREAARAPGWPRGMSVAQVLHQLGAPPLKLPGTPFPGRTPTGAKQLRVPGADPTAARDAASDH